MQDPPSPRTVGLGSSGGKSEGEGQPPHSAPIGTPQLHLRPLHCLTAVRAAWSKSTPGPGAFTQELLTPGAQPSPAAAQGLGRLWVAVGSRPAGGGHPAVTSGFPKQGGPCGPQVPAMYLPWEQGWSAAPEQSGCPIGCPRAETAPSRVPGTRAVTPRGPAAPP